MFANKVNQSIVWGGKGKDRVPLIINLTKQEFEEALEGLVIYKIFKMNWCK